MATPPAPPPAPGRSTRARRPRRRSTPAPLPPRRPARASASASPPPKAPRRSTSGSPAAWNTTGLSDGGYDLRAIATDHGGNSTTSALVTNIAVDNHAPTVTLTAPQYVNAAAPGTVTLTAASPDTDVASVDFYECSNASSGCSTGSWNLI